MPYSISLEAYDGYPTTDSIRVWVSLSVIAAGNYYTVYDVYTSNGRHVANGTGGKLQLTANQSINGPNYGTSGLYKTITGLTPNTSYYIVGTLLNYDTDDVICESDPLYFTTKSLYGTTTIYYYDGNQSTTDKITGTGYIEGPFKTDWDFLGWSTSTNSYDIDYEAWEEYTSGTSNTTLRLYAVYVRESTIYCYFRNGSSGALDSNKRTKIQYRCNTSTTASSTNYYNSITLPNFGSAMTTITTTNPARDWNVIGWRTDVTADINTYDIGETVALNASITVFYAVYSNECSITYNSNGGSGTMSKSGPVTAYYNAYGRFSTPTIPVKSCSFTAPSGKKFSHWNVRSDDTGTSYDAGEDVPTNYNTIFYAIWISGRPTNWSWTTAVQAGTAMSTTGSGTNMVIKPLTAKEWLAFADRIKEFYTYKNISISDTYWYRTVNGVSSGSEMTSTQANGARYLINQLNPPTSVPTAVSTGDIITAAFINGLKNSLNSIK